MRRHRDIEAGMNHEACLIAVSEIMGVPLDDLCRFVIITLADTTSGGHGSHTLMVYDSARPGGADAATAKMLRPAIEAIEAST
jgi:hypothetical protein